VSAAQGLTCTGAAGAVEATATVELITKEPAKTAATNLFIRKPAMPRPLPARSTAAHVYPLFDNA
jgi:hypothetical protein